MIKLAILFTGLLCAIGRFALSQTADGTILSRQAFTLTQPYDSLDEFDQWYFSREEYETAKGQTEWVGERIRYQSDSLAVEGFIYRPATNTSERYPVIIYNRGGTGNFGKISSLDLVDFYYWAQEGFIIVASNYRYVGGQGRFDQRGGDDVNDVMNLIPLIKDLPYADDQNVFMLGVSRGALMTNIALRRQIPVRAAATIAGVTDAQQSFARRSEFLEGWNNNGYVYDGLRSVLPDFIKKESQYYTKRSPVRWADEINTPLLLLHSRVDSKVLVENTLRYALSLEKAGKEYSVIIYAEGGHSLPDHRADRNQRIIEWFNLHKPDT